MNSAVIRVENGHKTTKPTVFLANGRAISCISTNWGSCNGFHLFSNGRVEVLV